MSEACWRVRPLLVPYADGDLDPSDRARVDEHLSTCSGCRVAVRALGDTAPFLGQVRMPEAFWVERERKLLEALEGPRANWWRTLSRLLLAPMPVPRVVAFAMAAALVWIGGKELWSPGPLPMAPAASHGAATVVTEPPRAAPRALFDTEGIARSAAYLG